MLTTPDPYNRVMHFYFPTPAGGGTWRPARLDPFFVTRQALVAPNSTYIGVTRSKFHADSDFWSPGNEFMVKKSLQNQIEDSETDHIERGLQNQYHRLGYNPEMLYGWQFHEKTLKFPRRFRCSRLRIFRFSKLVISDELRYEYYTVLCQHCQCGNVGSME